MKSTSLKSPGNFSRDMRAISPAKTQFHESCTHTQHPIPPARRMLRTPIVVVPLSARARWFLADAAKLGCLIFKSRPRRSISFPRIVPVSDLTPQRRGIGMMLYLSLSVAPGEIYLRMATTVRQASSKVEGRIHSRDSCEVAVPVAVFSKLSCGLARARERISYSPSVVVLECQTAKGQRRPTRFVICNRGRSRKCSIVPPDLQKRRMPSK